MRIVVDPDVCTGHGRCYSLAIEIYEPDDDGYCATRSPDVPPGLDQQARLGRRTAPSAPSGKISG